MWRLEPVPAPQPGSVVWLLGLVPAPQPKPVVWLLESVPSPEVGRCRDIAPPRTPCYLTSTTLYTTGHAHWLRHQTKLKGLYVFHRRPCPLEVELSCWHVEIKNSLNIYYINSICNGIINNVFPIQYMRLSGHKYFIGQKGWSHRASLGP